MLITFPQHSSSLFLPAEVVWTAGMRTSAAALEQRRQNDQLLHSSSSASIIASQSRSNGFQQREQCQFSG